MKELMKISDIKEEFSLIRGRDAIYFEKCNSLSESFIDITFSIDTTKCDRHTTSENYIQLRVKSYGIIFFKMQDIEVLPRTELKSCIEEIVDSDIVRENTETKPVKHIVITSYDAVFEFVCTDMDFQLIV